MTILITGASGFIGSKLLQHLRSTRPERRIAATAASPINGIHTISVKGGQIELSESDEQVLTDVELIIHAGSFTPKSNASVNDLTGCTSNIDFTRDLLALRMPKLKRVVYLSTIDVYADVPVIAESSPCGPKTLYGLSKQYCESYCRQWAKEHGASLAILRIGHTYGPGEERYKKLIPNVCRSLALDADIEVFGSGKEKRSFIYIDDVVAAVTAACNIENDEVIVNIVGGNTISVMELIERMIGLSGKNVGVKAIDTPSLGRDFVFDNSLMRRILLPTETPLDVGLAREIDYFATIK